MRKKFALFLIRWGYRLYRTQETKGGKTEAGVVVNPNGKWQPIKL